MLELGPLGPLVDRVRMACHRAGLLPVAVVAALVGVLASGALLWSQSRLVAPGGAAAAAEVLPRAVRVTTTQPPPAPAVVFVTGAVNRPGLVSVPDGARVADALTAAGGLREDADASRLNLAEKVRDGTRLYVPAVGEAVPPAVVAPSGTSGGAGTAGGAASAEHPVDLNVAGVEELDALPGVGPATAAAIVAHRDANGPFPSVDALGDVRGIGPAKLEALRPLVRV